MFYIANLPPQIVICHIASLLLIMTADFSITPNLIDYRFRRQHEYVGFPRARYILLQQIFTNPSVGKRFKHLT